MTITLNREMKIAILAALKHGSINTENKVFKPLIDAIRGEAPKIQIFLPHNYRNPLNEVEHD